MRTGKTIQEALLKVAILGTDRGRLSGEVRQQLQDRGLLGANHERGSSAELLVLNSKWQVFSRAGKKLDVFSGIFPEKAGEDLPILPANASGVLQEILNEGKAPFLREMLVHVQQSHQVVPPELLPELFSEAIDKKGLYGIMEQVAGNRGRWLARLVPGWRIFFPSLLENAETPEELGRYFEYLRKEDADRGLSWLEEHWNEMGGRFRMEVLKGLRIGSSDGDIPFLARCMEQEKLGIRRVAVALLMRRPASSFYQQLTEILHEGGIDRLDNFSSNHFSLTKSKVVTTFVEQFPYWKDLRSNRTSAHFLYTLGRFMPLTYWGVEDVVSAVRVIDIMMAAKPEFLRGVSQNADLIRQPVWQEALLVRYLNNPLAPNWGDESIAYLFQYLSKEVYWKVAVGLLKSSELAPITGTAENILLGKIQLPWNRLLSDTFLDYINRSLKREVIVHGGSRRFFTLEEEKSVMGHVSYYIHPGITGYLEREWVRQSGEFLSHDRRLFLENVRFRQKMLTSIYAPDQANIRK